MEGYVVIGAGTNGCIKNTNDNKYNVIPISNGLSVPQLPPAPILPVITFPEPYYFTEDYLYILL